MERIEGARARVPERDEPPRRIGGRQVRVDRLLPEPEPREDVRRHVERVGRGGRDLRVGARRRQRLGGERRIVEGVDHVVRDARMIRLERKQFVQELRGALLLGVGRIVLGRRRPGSRARRRSSPHDRRETSSRALPSPPCSRSPARCGLAAPSRGRTCRSRRCSHARDPSRRRAPGPSPPPRLRDASS